MERLGSSAEIQHPASVLHITGDVVWPALHLNHPLQPGSAPHTWLLGLGAETPPAAAKGPVLILIEGNLRIDGALTSDGAHRTTHLVVTGDAHVRNAVVDGQLLQVQGALQVDDLLWGHGHQGAVQVHGGLQARVALFTLGYGVQIHGAEQVEFLMDEVRPGVRHRAEFASEIVEAVFPPELQDGVDMGAYTLSSMVDRSRVVAAAQAGGNTARSSADIHADLPLAGDLCTDDAISIVNILAVLRTPVIAHKQHKAYGWFQQTDFSLCRRHVDDEGDQRDDNVFVTVWKTWDFYLSVEQVPAPEGLWQRLVALMARSKVPHRKQLLLVYRRYADGEPGEWLTLDPQTAPDAWRACQHAWRGVLDYVRKAVGQHRERYPLYHRLESTLTAKNIESLTSLPVFTEQYNDWWDSDRNGYWEGDVWVGARQPCMHDGEPWARALKFSWKNGDDAPGDDEYNAHSAYQINIDEAREGPPAVEFTYAQRQNDSRTALPRVAADHITRLLRFYRLVEARVRERHAQAQAAQAEAQRIESAVHLLGSPPLAADLPDVAVFPLDLLELSAQWQADGEAYVAAIRAHQLSMDAKSSTAMQATDDTPGAADDRATEGTAQDEKEAEPEADSETPAMPEEPRKPAAPTVLQLARVVNRWADEDLAARFRQRFSFAPDAYVRHAANAGCFIGPVFALDDGRVIARVGPVYGDAARWMAVQGMALTPLPALQGLGRSPDRRCFARSDGHHITTHQGFEGPEIARFALPQGNEGLPPHIEVQAGPQGGRCDTLIPFNDGQRVLLANPTGVYLLHGGTVQRIHPQEFDEDGPYTWPKNQGESEEGVAELALDMLHVALSPDERHIALGDQDSPHLLLDAQGHVLRRYEPLSSYPHHAAFSHDGRLLFANACHLYSGCTLAATLGDAPPQPDADSADAVDEGLAINTSWRVYASATLPGQWIAGDANGYLHAVSNTGQRLWRHHIGSTISAVEISADGGTVWAASYGGYLVQLRREEAGMDPYSIGTSPYTEVRRWIFWSDEAAPLCW